MYESHSIERFRCPFCERTYERKSDADACAAKGPLCPLPTGLIFQAKHGSEGYSEDVFYAIAEPRQMAGTVFYQSHEFDYLLWVTRDNGKPDVLGQQTEGGFRIAPRARQHRPNLRHPAFWRMVSWLDSQKIPVTFWDGEKPAVLSADAFREEGVRESSKKPPLSEP